MIELQLHELKLVSGGGPVTDNIAGNVANAATTKGGSHMGGFCCNTCCCSDSSFPAEKFFRCYMVQMVYTI
ncbi:putative secreted protein [Neisseria gonorrhoeae]|nr:putative secreted protein [Neisseria gonorrhoeae]